MRKLKNKNSLPLAEMTLSIFTAANTSCIDYEITNAGQQPQKTL